MKKGFTLLELIIVIIIIGVLATLGFTQYLKVVEKGRTAEAKSILGQLRTMQYARKMEGYGYADSVSNLAVDAPTTCSGNAHYYKYDCDIDGSCDATRCFPTGGKNPPGPEAYIINLSIDGILGGTPGYY